MNIQDFADHFERLGNNDMVSDTYSFDISSLTLAENPILDSKITEDKLLKIIRLLNSFWQGARCILRQIKGRPRS